MYPIGRLHDIAELEIFVFGFSPETMCVNHASRTEQMQSSPGAQASENQESSIVLERFRYDLNTGCLVFYS